MSKQDVNETPDSVMVQFESVTSVPYRPRLGRNTEVLRLYETQ